MSRILVIGADAGGNVPPALAIAGEVARRGHVVELAGVRPRDPSAVAALGAVPFPTMDSFDMTTEAGRLGTLRKLLRFTQSRDVGRDAAAIVAARRPDHVVVDCMMLPAVRAAVSSGIPTTVLFHTFAAYWAGTFARGPIAAILAARGLAPVRWWGAAAARLVAAERRLDPIGATPIDFEWTGSTETGTAPAPGDPPLVLVSLSSIWAPGQADAYRRIATALGSLPVRAVVTTGGVEVEGGIDAPPNVEVRGRVPHGEILPRASLVVGHGGHSTAMRALAHGVPLLVMPVNPLADQALVGRAVQRAGLGRVIPLDSSPARIGEAVRALLADEAVRAAAAATGERLRAVDGAVVAADRIETLLGERARTTR